jgi:hypothetical protein
VHNSSARNLAGSYWTKAQAKYSARCITESASADY